MARDGNSPKVYVATSSGVIKIKGQIHRYIQGHTVPGDSPLIKALPERFRLVDVAQAGIVIGHESSEPPLNA